MPLCPPPKELPTELYAKAYEQENPRDVPVPLGAVAGRGRGAGGGVKLFAHREIGELGPLRHIEY